MPSFPSFSVNDLKDRATKAKDAGVHKFADTRDKYSSTPSNKLDWDPNHKPPPPPPPGTSSSTVAGHARTSSNLSRTAMLSPPPRPPPVIRRDARPDQSSSPPPPYNQPQVFTASSSRVSNTSQSDKVDWANLSPEDMEVFFSWLDEYFAGRFRATIPPRSVNLVGKRVMEPASTQGPPPLATWSRPKQSTIISSNTDDDFTLSYPPPTTYGCSALDLAHYFHPSTHWDTPWYTSDHPLPPLMQTSHPPGFTMGWESRGTTKTLRGGFIFGDLSFCWYTIQFSTASPSDPNDTRSVKRSAKYLPRPKPLDQAALIEAHETYGETIAGFAESFEGTGQYCARGECWDLASEALKYFDQYDYVPKPVPSTSCTHGHLIFEGKATGKGLANQVGRWRGGDDRVRRGDIAQWRSVKIGMGPRGSAVLGNPEHTAIIVSDTIPSAPVTDGQIVKPAVLGSLEVVEQSVGSPPKRERYNLSELQEGELWIYRPVGMMAYLGTTLVAQCPDSVNALSL